MKILLLLALASIASAQCGKLVINPTTGKLDCVGTVIPAAFSTTFTAVTGLTVTTATHGQGVKVTGFCFDNATPANQIVQTAGNPTVAANGDIVFAWTGSKTGYCIISSLGAAVGPTGATGATGPAGSGLADPGSNGIIKRTALNVTAAAVAGTDYYVPGAGLALADLPATAKIRTCEVIVGDPGAASSVLADDNDSPSACGNKTGATLTITAVECFANAGSPTITPIITGGGATSILTGALTCGTGSFATGTLNGTPTQSNGGSIDANITTAGGTAKYIVIRITRTL